MKKDVPKIDAQHCTGEKPLPGKSIFLIKPGNQWLVDASTKPQPESLYMNLWFEGEVCILFGDTGIGKSIKAVQIGTEIAQKKKVIYFDFELSDKQFEARYSNNFFNHYNFPDNFYRAEINPNEADYKSAGFNSVTDYINASIEIAIQELGGEILIIDNITYLRQETEKAKDALPLMKDLKALKNKYGLSLLVLAHTPKRNLSQPISRNDLQGSKMLINFCDSAFALGESARDKSVRYLKQIKARNSEIIYDTENVALFEITKPGNFLMFTPVHGVQGVYTTNEHEHLKQYSKEDREEIKAKVIELFSKGFTQRMINKEIGIGLGTVNKYLKEHNI